MQAIPMMSGRSHSQFLASAHKWEYPAGAGCPAILDDQPAVADAEGGVVTKQSRGICGPESWYAGVFQHAPELWGTLHGDRLLQHAPRMWPHRGTWTFIMHGSIRASPKMAHRRSEASTVTRLGIRSRAGAALSRAGRTRCAPTLGVSLSEPPGGPRRSWRPRGSRGLCCSPRRYARALLGLANSPSSDCSSIAGPHFEYASSSWVAASESTGGAM